MRFKEHAYIDKHVKCEIEVLDLELRLEFARLTSRIDSVVSQAIIC